MAFDFTQLWLDGRPGNEYFWISYKIFGLLKPLTLLGVHPQQFETTFWKIWVISPTVAHPSGFLNLPTALLEHIWALKVHALDSVS